MKYYYEEVTLHECKTSWGAIVGWVKKVGHDGWCWIKTDGATSIKAYPTLELAKEALERKLKEKEY